MLEDWLVEMANIGYGRSKQELQLAVKKIMEKDKRKNPFTNNMPGRKWVRSFLKRHPKLSVRQSGPLPVSRALGCSKDILDKWFCDFEVFLNQHDLLNKADRIWNADESGFPLQQRGGKVMTSRGAKTVYSISSSSKQQITTLACINAAGQAIPPMHIFPGQRFRSNPLEGSVHGAYLGRSPSGWMDSELFHGWLRNHFTNSIPPARPVVLLLDGHSSHINLDTARYAKEEGILLYCLPPHTTHVLQPCDVGFFKPMKTNWNKQVTKYVCATSGGQVDKFTFARVFREAWDETIKPATLINSFKRAGICPLNRGAISNDKILPISACDTEPAQVYAQIS